jgi:hypothetical protein
MWSVRIIEIFVDSSPISWQAFALDLIYTLAIVESKWGVLFNSIICENIDVVSSSPT